MGYGVLKGKPGLSSSRWITTIIYDELLHRNKAVIYASCDEYKYEKLLLVTGTYIFVQFKSVELTAFFLLSTNVDEAWGIVTIYSYLHCKKLFFKVNTFMCLIIGFNIIHFKSHQSVCFWKKNLSSLLAELLETGPMGVYICSSWWGLLDISTCR